MDGFLCHQIEVNFDFAAVMVDRLLVLDKTTQVLDVCLQEHLGKELSYVWVTSAKGMVRLNRSQMSIIFTYEVFGRAFETLMNLLREMVNKV